MEEAKLKWCPHFLKGKCRFGDSCWFPHLGNPDPAPEPAPRSPPLAQNLTTGGSGPGPECARVKPKTKTWPRDPRVWGHIFLDLPPAYSEFGLVPAIIGHHGENTGTIAGETGTQIRIRGIGSGHMEFNGQEARVPLMIAITHHQGNVDELSLAFAKMMTVLDYVTKKLHRWCQDRQMPEPPRFFYMGDRSLDFDSNLYLSSLIRRFPKASLGRVNARHATPGGVRAAVRGARAASVPAGLLPNAQGQSQVQTQAQTQGQVAKAQAQAQAQTSSSGAGSSSDPAMALAGPAASAADASACQQLEHGHFQSPWLGSGCGPWLRADVSWAEAAWLWEAAAWEAATWEQAAWEEAAWLGNGFAAAGAQELAAWPEEGEAVQQQQLADEELEMATQAAISRAVRSVQLVLGLEDVSQSDEDAEP